MLKTCTILILLVLCCPFSFGRYPAGELAIAASENKTEKAVTGTVEQVVLADPENGIHPAVILSLENDQSLIILVNTTTTIYNKLSGAITLEDIHTSDTVKVRYHTTMLGARNALAIFLLHR